MIKQYPKLSQNNQRPIDHTTRNQFQMMIYLSYPEIDLFRDINNFTSTDCVDFVVSFRMSCCSLF